jgi:subtilisin family serine protease
LEVKRVNHQKAFNWIRRVGFLLLVLVLAFSTVEGLAGFAAAIPDRDAPDDGIPLEAEILFSEADFTGSEHQNPKLDYSLANLAAAGVESTRAAAEWAESTDLRLLGDRVEVYIVTSEADLDAALNAVAELGGEVSIISSDKDLLQVWLPVGALETITTYPSVYYVRRPDVAEFDEVIAPEFIEATRAVSEGLAAMNGPAWHTAGFKGAGVKVAIIDGGFEGYKALLGTDLPASVTAKSFVSGQAVDSGGKHGTGVAEIVYDIAPEAQFYLAKVNSTLEIDQAVDWAISNNVKVINTSLGYYNVGPGDGTGFFATVAQKARSAGILWVKSAGNSRQRHWAGAYTSGNVPNTHYWAPNVNVKWISSEVSAGTFISANLRWDDWTNVNQDYDLLLVRKDGDNVVEVAKSENPQTGTTGQTPTERISGTASTAGTYGFMITRKSSVTRDVNFGFFVNSYLEDPVFDRSLTEPGDVATIMTVGALNVNDPSFPQEPYSSQGPTNGPGGTPTGGRIKPNIAAYARVSTESYAPGTFSGTSAAAPHVAGAAALVLSANPGYTPAQVQSFLESRAKHMGSAGQNNIFGHGRLWLGDPSESEPDPQPDPPQGGNQTFLPLLVSGGGDSGATPNPLINGDFEQGPGVGWTEYSSNGFPLILEFNPGAAHSGNWGVWLSGVSDANETAHISQQVTIPSNQFYLNYYYVIDSYVNSCTQDYFNVKINNTTVRTDNLCQANNTANWTHGSVNLSAYTGSTVTLMFEVTSINTSNDTYSSLYLDTVSLTSGVQVGSTGIVLEMHTSRIGDGEGWR